MSYKVIVDGAESFEIAKECVRQVKFTTDIPLDSNARTKDVGSTLVITGRILTAVDGDPLDSTRKLALWSAVPAEKADCYRTAVVEVISAGQVVRKYEVPNAFVMEYSEEMDDETGVGTFYLHVKQKKDENDKVKIEGGYAGE